jgi:predicted DsbA family dithiol-disulfide isomerase
MTESRPTVTVFADVGGPFAHIGLRRFVRRRHDRGRDDVVLRIRAWPLELVNGSPLDAAFVAEEIVDIRAQVTPDLFGGFVKSAFPQTSIPALALTAAAYRKDLATGEAVGLGLRDALFEEGRDVADPMVLGDMAAHHGIDVTDDDVTAVDADHADGVALGVVGSPYFISDAGGFFCPSLDVGRDMRGHLRITAEPQEFEAFLDTCFD